MVRGHGDHRVEVDDEEASASLGASYQKQLLLDDGGAGNNGSWLLTRWVVLSLLGALTIGFATLSWTGEQSPPSSKLESITALSSSARLSSSSNSESFETELSNIKGFIQAVDDDASSNIFFSSEDEEEEEEEGEEEAADAYAVVGEVVEVSSSKARPNVIFVMADDLGYANIGDEDSYFDFATPFLSKLAKSGVVMGSYYTQESCTPARAALLTGRYPLTMGMQLSSINAYQSRGLPVEETLLPQVLKAEGGYTTFMLGKWNLGHYHSKYLPNARGFDYFLAFMDGQSYYWSKKNPKLTKFTDLLYGDEQCYGGYDGTDRHDYSTFLYRDKAVKAIESHDFDSSPMFMYLAFQAVHDPFYDFERFESGIPKHYLSTKMYTKILDKVAGRKQRQYAMALTLMDDAVESVHDALDEAGQLDNTYIIFTSDNGGCYSSGGKSGNYRGTKGSLWEGGTKVDAFLYSKGLIDEDSAGTTYTGLMHVSDWFPTILDMAGISNKFTAKEGYDLDGVSQWDYFFTSAGDESPRDFMLYNYIANIDGGEHSFDILSNAPVAVRNKEGFKLIHAFVGNPSSMYYGNDDINNDDGEFHSSVGCTQSDSMDSSGDYTYMLYDLNVDPYETNNLYSQDAYAIIKNQLYAQIFTYYSNSAVCLADSEFKVNKNQKSVWQDAGGYIVPWVDISEKELEEEGYPTMCSSEYESDTSPFTPWMGEHTAAGQGDDEAYTKSPSPKPSHKPSSKPSHKPTNKPSSKPSKKPTKSPSPKPSLEPTPSPTDASEPTQAPFESTGVPTPKPTISLFPEDIAPTPKPTHKPTTSPTSEPSEGDLPTPKPTHSPDYVKPTNHPTVTGYTHRPTHSPDYIRPTNHPTVTGYTHRPTHDPSTKPSSAPSSEPSEAIEASEDLPTHKPTHSPDYIRPTNHPTVTGYTHRPTHDPSAKPSSAPSSSD